MLAPTLGKAGYMKKNKVEEPTLVQHLIHVTNVSFSKERGRHIIYIS